MRLTPLKPKELIEVLHELGYVTKRQTGSHLILKNNQSGRIVVVPIHPKDLKVGLIRAILRQIELSPGEFLKFFKR